MVGEGGRQGRGVPAITHNRPLFSLAPWMEEHRTWFHMVPVSPSITRHAWFDGTRGHCSGGGFSQTPPLAGQAPDRVYVPSLPSPFFTEPPSPLPHPMIATLVPKASKYTGVRLTAVWDLKVREERGKRRSIV